MKVLFIHHSTGANLISQGKLRKLLRDLDPSIGFWDHSYNLFLPQIWQLTSKIIPYHTGLTDNTGKITGDDYHLQIANTDPQGYKELFNQKITDPPSNALSKIILNFDIIIFKSCFPVTKIESGAKLAHYKECYLSIRNRITNFSDKQFIIFTPPPLRREMTKNEYAQRARTFSEWLKSDNYLQGSTNISAFDFFGILADADQSGPNQNMLRRKYAGLLPFDSHPNRLANREAAALFATFLVAALRKFNKGRASD